MQRTVQWEKKITFSSRNSGIEMIYMYVYTCSWRRQVEKELALLKF